VKESLHQIKIYDRTINRETANPDEGLLSSGPTEWRGCLPSEHFALKEARMFQLQNLGKRIIALIAFSIVWALLVATLHSLSG
jgi:hypothetical protein